MTRLGDDKSETTPNSSPKGAPSQPEFPIVGIGASAGGLEAATSFLKTMPPDAGIAFVLVVHLDPQHISIMPELLQKHTRMPVVHAEDGVRIAPDHVYVIPPNRNLTILNGQLHLLEIVKTGTVNLPIDSFLRALAADCGARAAAVILSGTGSDGSLGLRAIKDQSGLVLAQDPESADFDGMPRSAIATGLVDFVLPPDEMPSQLIRCIRDLGLRKHEPSARVLQAVKKVCAVLHARTGHDFSHYKSTTVCRRIERRMTIHQITLIDDYVRYLQESEREADTLFKELLIGVTSFFRDPEAYAKLGEEILPQLLDQMPEGALFRAWVPGCATGEEAYSLAILLHEVCGKTNRPFTVQVFGTDINEEAIAAARAGVFPEGIVADLGQARLDRYFTREADGRFRIGKEIREKLVFAPQNLIKDSPFTNLSLLSCRNLLIYLDAEVQRQLLPMFHYCLAPEGILLLGSSETTGAATEIFEPLDRKWKIFRRRPTAAYAQILDFPGRGSSEAGTAPGLSGPMQRAEELSALQLVESILQQSDTAPCAIVNAQHEIVYIHGRTGPFLELPAGRMNANLLQMARPGLRTELAVGLRAALTHRNEVVRRGLAIESREGTTWIDLTIKSLPGRTSLQDLLMVIFQEVNEPGPDGETRPLVREAPVSELSVAELEQELRYTRESLQSTIEQLETSNEELKSTNEELQSTNEELQSTNEELETSKEELQSMNEESTTVNQELQTQIGELARVNDDLVNLLDSTELATIFLDADLKVRRFTPLATSIIPLTAADYGRPIDNFASVLPEVDLAEQGRRALADLATHRCDAESRKGRHFVVKTRPYRTLANVIDGVVITFDDVTEFRRLESLQRLAVVVRDANDAITLQDGAGRIVAWNRGAERTYGYSEAEAVQMTAAELVPEADRKQALDLATRAMRGDAITSRTCRRVDKDGNEFEVWFTASLIEAEADRPAMLATTERRVEPGETRTLAED